MNWRVQVGDSSEKGQEAQAVLGMVDDSRELAGEQAIEWLLMDGPVRRGPLAGALEV